MSLKAIGQHPSASDSVAVVRSGEKSSRNWLNCHPAEDIEDPCDASRRSASGRAATNRPSARLGLRACFAAELKDRIALYSLGHEKELCHRPLGFGMGFPARPPGRAIEEGQATRPLPTRHLRRHLLRAQNRLPLETVAPRL